jgi:4-hydroxythreonine-4-phosphate dehydrogenase
LIVGDESVLKKAARLSGNKLRYKLAMGPSEIDFGSYEINFLDIAKITGVDFDFGAVSSLYGRASIDYINEAVSLIKLKKADLIVTAPIHKYAASLSGFKWPGHTEYLAHLVGTDDYAMMFKGGPLKIVLATTHVPLKDVSKSLSANHIILMLRLMNSSLKRYFRVNKPHIAVCGLNPHAGEGGVLGDEERRIILPALIKAKREKICTYGPFAADALFYDLYRGRYDAALCMYHDQGLVALKMIARDESVNITLGLPFIRTSPAHGTALDIAKRFTASAESMKNSIRTAVTMFLNSR